MGVNLQKYENVANNWLECYKQLCNNISIELQLHNEKNGSKKIALQLYIVVL